MIASTETSAPLTTVQTGRDTRTGRFGPGNAFAKGNPHNARTAAVRAALAEAVTPEGIKAAAEKLLAQAIEGDRFAFAELLDRVIGKPVGADILARIEAIEEALAAQGDIND